MTRDEIPTPALLLDLDRFERNLQRMTAHVRRTGKSIRPHAKTHKCPEIAKRQIQAGALGVACAKLGEAEVMAAAGIRGLLITTEIVPPTSIARLMKLVAEAPDTMIVVDHAENVAAIGTAASAAGVVVNVLVDVDMGNRRTGAQPGEPALALARAVTRQRSLRLRGLQGYAGHCAHVIGWKARREASLATMAGLMDTRQLLERQGLPVEVVAGGSTGTYDIDVELAGLMDTRQLLERQGLPVEVVAGGSTGTYDIDVELAGLTELQSGSYCVMDLEYRKIGGRDGDALTDFEMALTVLTTVVSVPTADRAVVDGGLKAFSTDKPFPPESVERPGLTYGFAGDEHGRLTITDPTRAPRLGERIEFFPPHCDPTINLYDRMYVMRGDRVDTVWTVAARGRSD